MFEPVRIGVIGLGNFGWLHAQTLTGIAEAHLVALVDTSPERLTAARQRLPAVPCWDNLDRALAESNAEAWVVASSTASHVHLAQTLLSKGCRVLLEKPIADNLADAERLAPLVAADSSNLMLGHVVLFNSEFCQLCEEVQRRGSLAFIDCVRHRPITTMQLYPGESPLHLTMVHDLYCVLALRGGAEPCRFRIDTHCTASGACDLISVRLQWPDGVLASLTASFLTPAGMPGDGFDRLEVFGAGWAARIQPNPRPFELWDDRARWPMELEILAGGGRPSGMLAEELRTFCRVVRGQQQVPLGARYADALQVQRWFARLEAEI